MGTDLSLKNILILTSVGSLTGESETLQVSRLALVDSYKMLYPNAQLAFGDSDSRFTANGFELIGLLVDNSSLTSQNGPITPLEKLLGKCFKAGAPSASIQLLYWGDNSGSTVGIESKLAKAFRLAGFIDVSAAENGPYQGTIRLRAKKPAFTSAPLKLPGVKAAQIEGNEDEEEIIDEAELVEDAEWGVANSQSTTDSCTPSEAKTKRRACKNCTCGLAEEISGEKDGAGQQEKSACGNCNLGDAFRCSTCPYLGMPPFKKGDGGSVKLSKVDDF